MSYKGSGLLLVVFHFGFSHSLKIGSMRKGRSCPVCAVHGAGSMQMQGHPCVHAHVSVWRTEYAAPHFSPSPGFLSMQLGT